MVSKGQTLVFGIASPTPTYSTLDLLSLLFKYRNLEKLLLPFKFIDKSCDS